MHGQGTQVSGLVLEGKRGGRRRRCEDLGLSRGSFGRGFGPNSFTFKREQ